MLSSKINTATIMALTNRTFYIYYQILGAGHDIFIFHPKMFFVLQPKCLEN